MKRTIALFVLMLLTVSTVACASPSAPSAKNDIPSAAPQETDIPEEDPMNAQEAEQPEPNDEEQLLPVESSLILSGNLYTLEELEHYLVEQTNKSQSVSTPQASVQESNGSRSYYYFVPELTLENYELYAMEVSYRYYFFYFLPIDHGDYDNRTGEFLLDENIITVGISYYIETDDIIAHLEQRLSVPRAYYGDFYDPSSTALYTTIDDHHFGTAIFPKSMAPYQNVHGLISYRKVTINPDHVAE